MTCLRKLIQIQIQIQVNLTFTLLLTLKMTAAKAVEMSVTSTNSLSQDYTNLDDQLPQTKLLYYAVAVAKRCANPCRLGNFGKARVLSLRNKPLISGWSTVIVKYSCIPTLLCH